MTQHQNRENSELNLRRELAIAYRLISHWQLDDSTYTHLSARINTHQFLILKFGLRFEEVTASNLLTIDLHSGEIIDNINNKKNKNKNKNKKDIYNPTGYVIHSAIYQARPDINVIFHLHTHAGIAVSATKSGLLPLSQFALHCYPEVSYYDYHSLELSTAETKTLVNNLGDKNLVLFLRNHGTVTCGRMIAEAVFYTYHLEQACKIQVSLMPYLISKKYHKNLIMPNKTLCQTAHKTLLNFEKNLGERDFTAWRRLILKLYPDCLD